MKKLFPSRAKNSHSSIIIPRRLSKHECDGRPMATDSDSIFRDERRSSPLHQETPGNGHATSARNSIAPNSGAPKPMTEEWTRDEVDSISLDRHANNDQIYRAEPEASNTTQDERTHDPNFKAEPPQELELLEREAKRLQEEIDRIKYTSKLAELEKENTALKDDNAQLRRQFTLVSAELSRILANEVFLDDQYFISSLKGLQHRIEDWAMRHYWARKYERFTGRIPEKQRIHNHLHELSNECSDLLLGSEDGRPLVVEAYVWSFLEEEVFGARPLTSNTYSKGYLWASSVRPELCRMDQFLHSDPKPSDAKIQEYQRWKASTTKLLTNCSRPPSKGTNLPVDSLTVSAMADHILGILEPWMSAKSAEEKRACMNGLSDIFVFAIGLDLNIMQQLSLIVLESSPSSSRPRYGFPFRGVLMETVRDHKMFEDEPVSMVISPALVRYGTFKGERYDERMVLVKSRVLPFEASSLRRSVVSSLPWR